MISRHSFYNFFVKIFERSNKETMKANIHFNHYQYRGEQNLVQDLHDEIIQIKGMNVSYIKRTL